MIHAIGQALRDESPLIIGGESARIMVGLARDLDRGLDPQSGRVCHLELQFSFVRLAKDRQCQ